MLLSGIGHSGATVLSGILVGLCAEGELGALCEACSDAREPVVQHALLVEVHAHFRRRLGKRLRWHRTGP